MIGILTEKPSAARNFAKALGARKSGSCFTGTFQGEPFLIVHSVGHLYGLVDPRYQVPDAFSGIYGSWDISNLPWDESIFSWRKEAFPKTKDVVTSIKNALSDCSEVVIATDNDPSGEGDLLATEILLENHIVPAKFSRMHFTDEAPATLQKSFIDRSTIPVLTDNPEYRKGLYRERFDFLSMQHTRIATYFSAGNPLRQGRLKSVMVRMVGQQLDAVKSYVRVPYFQTRFKDEHGNVYASPKETLYKTKEEVPIDNYHPSKVAVDSVTTKHTVPPKLLDLAGLSSILSTKGIKASEVLQTYQNLYEHQIVSYPRTEDKTITPEQFNEMLPLIHQIASIVGVDSSLLTHMQMRKTHVKNGGTHGANRPGTTVPSSLEALRSYGSCASLIYEILAKNFLAMFAEDYIYEQEKGHLVDYPDFVGKTNIPKSMGFKQIFNDGDDKDDTTGTHLGTEASPSIFEGYPKPPQKPTMKWLMKQLEQYDVGTGATRTSIYADVTNQKGGKSKCPLLTETKGKINMTHEGEISYHLIEGTHIADVKTTEAMQQCMRDIAAGKVSVEEKLHEMQKIIKDDITIISQNAKAMNLKPKESAKTIPGVWNGVNVAIRAKWVSHIWTEEEAKALFAGEEVCVYGLQGKDGKTYDVKGKLDYQTYKGQKYVGFAVTGYLNDDRIQGVWNGKNILIKKEWGGHTWTQDELKQLFAGKEVSIEGLTSSNGSTYGVKGKLMEQTYKGKKYVGFKVVDYLNGKENTTSDNDYITGTWRGKTVSIKSSWNGHIWTEEEVRNLFAGREISVYGFKSKKGSTYGGQGHTGNVLGRDASLEHRVAQFIAAVPVHKTYGKIPFAPYSVCHFLAESPGYGRINASLFQITFQSLMTQLRHFHVLESGNAGYLLTFL